MRARSPTLAYEAGDSTPHGLESPAEIPLTQDRTRNRPFFRAWNCRMSCREQSGDFRAQWGYGNDSTIVPMMIGLGGLQVGPL